MADLMSKSRVTGKPIGEKHALKLQQEVAELENQAKRT